MMDQRRAIQIYLENRDKFQGVPQSDAVNLIRRSGGLPAAAAAPVEAAPTAIPVAPAAPAPMAAPAPVAVVEPAPAPAPAPEPAYMNAQEAALAAYNLANPDTPAPAAVKGKPVDYAAMADRLLKGRKREELEANAYIARTTQLPEETQKLIDDRLARYGIELTQADKDRQQATWMAVAQAGMKMAQSQSPYFMQALASGMEAGIDGYSEAKAKAAEKKARLQDAKEELSMKAIELRAQAVKDAIAARKDATQSAAAETALRKDALGLIINQQTAPEQIRAVGLNNRQTEAQIANLGSMVLERGRASARADRAAVPGAGGGVSTKVINAQRGLIQGQINANNQELNDITIPRDRKARLLADNDRLRRDLSGLQMLLAGNSGASNNNPLGLNISGR